MKVVFSALILAMGVSVNGFAETIQGEQTGKQYCQTSHAASKGASDNTQGRQNKTGSQSADGRTLVD